VRGVAVCDQRPGREQHAGDHDQGQGVQAGDVRPRRPAGGHAARALPRRGAAVGTTPRGSEGVAPQHHGSKKALRYRG
ncbi:unnamed protein product, partial [Ectocarpus fasciculatus]